VGSEKRRCLICIVQLLKISIHSHAYDVVLTFKRKLSDQDADGHTARGSSGAVIVDSSLKPCNNRASFSAFLIPRASSVSTWPGMEPERMGSDRQGSFTKSSRKRDRKECVNEPNVDASFSTWIPWCYVST
jgi:hypothetical protein